MYVSLLLIIACLLLNLMNTVNTANNIGSSPTHIYNAYLKDHAHE